MILTRDVFSVKEQCKDISGKSNPDQSMSRPIDSTQTASNEKRTAEKFNDNIKIRIVLQTH